MVMIPTIYLGQFVSPIKLSRHPRAAFNFETVDCNYLLVIELYKEDPKAAKLILLFCIPDLKT